MSSKHSDANQLVAYRLPRDLVGNVKVEIARTGEAEKAFVAAALQAELNRRTDLRKATMLTITDTAGTSGSVTVESYDVADTIRPWYPEAPDEVYLVIEELQRALDRNEDVGGMCEYLSITIERV